MRIASANRVRLVEKIDPLSSAAERDGGTSPDVRSAAQRCVGGAETAQAEGHGVKWRSLV